MAGHTVSAGVFEVKDAEPEATLELFSDYCEVMKRVFRLRRRIHPTTGARIEFDDDEKKDLMLVEGGEDMQKLFKYTGQVLDADTYDAAVTKIKEALQKRGNRTAAVFKLFNNNPQGTKSFDAWHTEIYKAAQLIDWTAPSCSRDHCRRTLPIRSWWTWAYPRSRPGGRPPSCLMGIRRWSSG